MTGSMKVAFLTLGCKVNFYETEKMIKEDEQLWDEQLLVFFGKESFILEKKWRKWDSLHVL